MLTPNCICAETLSPSVTATLRMLSPKRASLRCWPRTGRRRPGHQVPIRSWTAAVLPVAGHSLSAQPQPGLDVGELSIAVRGLIEVHEVHVDLAPREIAVELSVQV